MTNPTSTSQFPPSGAPAIPWLKRLRPGWPAPEKSAPWWKQLDPSHLKIPAVRPATTGGSRKPMLLADGDVMQNGPGFLPDDELNLLPPYPDAPAAPMSTSPTGDNYVTGDNDLYNYPDSMVGTSVSGQGAPATFPMDTSAADPNAYISGDTGSDVTPGKPAVRLRSKTGFRSPIWTIRSSMPGKGATILGSARG